MTCCPPAVRGDLLAKLGRLEEAREEFGRAAALTGNERERALFRARADACAIAVPGTLGGQAPGAAALRVASTVSQGRPGGSTNVTTSATWSQGSSCSRT
jgi:hypothetical protein